MRFLAYNLPAFHRIPENDMWWGEGFTEWDNVKNAVKLFKWQEQPQRPLNDNYYDLSTEKDVLSQVALAKQYGIDGFIYYHYWFNGKLLFEKPCELLLRRNDVDFNYCFCWANETWSRTWSGKEKEILIKQTFGGKEDWDKHIRYFLPFFRDKRYIKIDESPVLFFYSSSKIEKFDEMIEYWNEFLIRNGLKELYVIETINTFNPMAISKYSKAITEFEPQFSLRYEINIFQKAYRLLRKKASMPEVFSYSFVWKKILERKKTYGERVIYPGAFVAWDNSPRKKRKSLIIKGSNPQLFSRNLDLLINSNRKNQSTDFIIINAWNEWGEGAFLEPSFQYRYEFLEVIKKLHEQH